MSETETETTEELVEEPDNTELTLWTWGISGQPSSWALSTWVQTIETIRSANRGATDDAAVQAVLDETFPDKGYLAANVMLAHPPTGEFALEQTDALSVHVVTPPDEDLALPADNIQWDWGDGTLQFDAGCPDHTYTDAGTYGVKLYISVAGARYGSGEEITVGDPPPAPPLDPGVAERAATVFESETDDLPNTSTSPEANEAQATEVAEQIEAGRMVPGDAYVGVGGEPYPAPGGEAAAYDPGEHTVVEVLAYAAEHPDEADDIAAAEEAGQGRVTILDRLA